jgi:hypothetical protein
MRQAPAAGIVVALRELIDAVDRRVPQLERAGEPRVAQIAAALRGEAACRLEEMSRRDVEADEHDGGLVDAIMTDDGGPAPGDTTPASTDLSAVLVVAV